MSNENCQAQITLRADSAPMVNIYAESAADALGIMQEIEAIGLSTTLALWTYEIRRLSAPAPATVGPITAAQLTSMAATPLDTEPAPDKPKAAPQHQNRKPVDDFDPDDPHQPVCPKHRKTMAYRETRWGTEYECRSSDNDEARGYCRWIRDDKGIRRRPTRVELDAAKAANRRGEAVYE